MRIDGLDGGCFRSVLSHPWAERPAHGLGTQRVSFFPGLRIEILRQAQDRLSGTQFMLSTHCFHPVTERSGCRWESHSI
jgi:hypothetical protein